MKNSPKRTLYIIDEAFEKIEGHLYEYNKSVVDIFRQQGYDVVIYGHGNLEASIREELQARAWFTFNPSSSIRKIPFIGALIYRWQFWQKFERELVVFFNEINSSAGNILIFFPNVYWYNILPIAKAISRNTLPISFLFRTSIFDAIQLPGFMKPVTLAIIRQAAKKLSKRPNTYAFSDSEVIADEWIQKFSSPMGVLSIPHLHSNIKEGTTSPEKIRMYLPGGMRIEKGAQLLTEAFEVLSQKNPEILKHVTLVTQFLGNDDILEEYKKRLAVLPVENIFLDRLSSEEYNDQLREADVILIPYQVSEGYRARTSGILAEAIASSKPFITTEGTWMSLQAKKFDTGLLIQDRAADDLAQAIITITHDYQKYHLKASQAHDKWMASQSREVFYDRLVRPLKRMQEEK